MKEYFRILKKQSSSKLTINKDFEIPGDGMFTLIPAKSSKSTFRGSFGQMTGGICEGRPGRVFVP